MKKITFIALMLVMLMLTSVVLCSCGGGKNSAVTGPTEILTKENVTLDEIVEIYTNGYLASQFKDILKIASKFEDNEDMYDEFEENWADQYEAYEDNYGKGFSVSIELGDENELKSKDLKSYKETLQGNGNTLKDYVKAYGKLDDDEIEDIADELGVKKSDLDDLMDIVGEIADELKKCEVDEGYEIEFTATIEGDDDDDEDDGELEVIKVNGNWICPTYFNTAYRQVMNYCSGLIYFLR